MGGAVSVADGVEQDKTQPKNSTQLLMQNERKPREVAASPSGMMNAIWDKTKQHPLIQSFPGTTKEEHARRQIQKNQMLQQQLSQQQQQLEQHQQAAEQAQVQHQAQMQAQQEEMTAQQNMLHEQLLQEQKQQQEQQQAAPDLSEIQHLNGEEGKNETENSGKIFDVSIPPGVPPHGFFQALCGGVVVDVQAPPDAYPGQLVRIDLGSATRPEDHDSLATHLFEKYDYDQSQSISVGELRQILIQEFQISDASKEELMSELQLSGVNENHALSLNEFQHWMRHVRMRLHLRHLQMMQKKAFETGTALEMLQLEAPMELEGLTEEQQIEYLTDYSKEEYNGSINLLKEDQQVNAQQAEEAARVAEEEAKAAELIAEQKQQEIVAGAQEKIDEANAAKLEAEQAAQKAMEAKNAAAAAQEKAHAELEALEAQRAKMALMKQEQQDMLDKLKQEHDEVKEQAERDAATLQKELMTLRDERERLEQDRATMDKESDAFKNLVAHEQRNIEKEKLFLAQETQNEKMIEEMKGQFQTLIDAREQAEDDMKERQRQKIKERIEKKRAAAAKKKEEEEAKC